MTGAALFALASLLGQDTDQYAWIAIRGRDTLSVERVTRSGAKLRAEVLVPSRVRLTVAAATTAQGCVTGAEVRAFPWGSADGATPLQVVAVRLDGDSVRVAVRARDVSRNVALPFAGARFVFAGDSYAVMALAVECALSSGADSVDLPSVAFPNLRSLTVRVRRRGSLVTVVTGDTSRVTLDDRGRPLRVELGTGGIVLARVSFDAALGPAANAPDYSALPGAPYTAEEVRVAVEPGVVLAGTLTLPLGARGRVPAVVTVSGSGPQDRDCFADIGGGWRPFRQLAETLAEQGVAALRFDDRGVGASTGDHAAGTELTAAADVNAVVRFLRSRPEIDPGQIMVLGHSEGARVAMLAGARDSTLTGLVLLSGAADPRAAVRAQALWVAEHGPNAGSARRDSLLAYLDRQMDSLAAAGRREVYRWDAQGLARQIRLPVAIFHGATDRQVPADQADSLAALFRRAGNAHVTLRVFPDLNHLLVRDPSGDFLQYHRLETAVLDRDLLAAVATFVRRAGSEKGP